MEGPNEMHIWVRGEAQFALEVEGKQRSLEVARTLTLSANYSLDRGENPNLFYSSFLSSVVGARGQHPPR